MTRITPADAGKTKAESGEVCRRTDHPRGCGENYTGRTRSQNEQGSPPRMRGKRAVVDAAQVSVGITPADAGKTS